MERVFVDTSFWVALLHPKDQHHQRAQGIKGKIARISLITTELVLAEFLNSFADKPQRRAASLAVDGVRSDPKIRVVNFSDTPFQSAFSEYKTYLDKEWGLVDCSSFCFMRAEGITTALAYDKHFLQARFTLLD